MQTTLALLDRALSMAPAAEWARRLGIRRSAFTNCKAAGHLSPVLAGNLAIELNEDPEHWMALAVIEGEKDSPAKARLARLMTKVRKL